jgi:hypothetical protein
MPPVTVAMLRGKDAAFRTSVLAAARDALLSSGVPETDRFHRDLELSADESVKQADRPDSVHSVSRT